MTPADKLRSAIEAWRRDEARERVQRWRGAKDAATPSDVAARHARLVSSGADELAQETEAMLDAREMGALRAHLARARAEAELAMARETLRAVTHERVSVNGDAWALGAVARELVNERDPRRRAVLAEPVVAAARRIVPLLRDARVSANEAAAVELERATERPDAGPDRDALAARAAALLDASEDAVGAALEWLRRTSKMPIERWHDLLAALRAPWLDALVPARDRWRRISTSALAELGLERELGARVRVERTHGGIVPRVRIAVIDAPGDIRIAPSKLEQGVASELAAAIGVGRALAMSLVSSALPVEVKRPIAATVPRAMGGLLGMMLADRAFIAKQRRLSGRDGEGIERLAALLVVLDVRLAAAALRARSAGSAGELLARALGGLEPPDPLVDLVAITPGALGGRLRAHDGALAVYRTMRETLDEDWWRNPRAAEPLRAAFARGATLSIEAFCEELGAHQAAAVAQLRDIWR